MDVVGGKLIYSSLDRTPPHPPVTFNLQSTSGLKTKDMRLSKEHENAQFYSGNEYNKRVKLGNDCTQSSDAYMNLWRIRHTDCEGFYSCEHHLWRCLWGEL